jgi:hypothetical protein
MIPVEDQVCLSMVTFSLCSGVDVSLIVAELIDPFLLSSTASPILSNAFATFSNLEPLPGPGL